MTFNVVGAQNVHNLFRRLMFHYWYFRQPPWDTGISPPELIEFITQHQPGRAVDIGCGTGTNVVTLVRAGWQVTGIDFAPRAITLAKRKLEEKNVHADLQLNDATKMDGISGPFDLAFDLGCFHGIPKNLHPNYLDQLNRILAPGRFWLMYGFMKAEKDPSTPGLTEVDIDRIAARFTRVSRQNGFGRGERLSAWFLFQKNINV